MKEELMAKAEVDVLIFTHPEQGERVITMTMVEAPVKIVDRTELTMEEAGYERVHRVNVLMDLPFKFNGRLNYIIGTFTGVFGVVIVSYIRTAFNL